MIWHYCIFVYSYSVMMIRYIHNSAFGYFSKLIKLTGFSENMFFVSCTNSYEIVIFTGIIELR